jgi:hypothetical protein
MDQPVIKDIQTIGITSSGAIITWTADYQSSGIVQWGRTTDYEFSMPVNIEYPGQPSIQIRGLTPDTTYYYKITLDGKSGTAAHSPTQVFKTLEPLYKKSLMISGISISAITGNSATITWVTDIPSIGQVDYDVNLPYANSTPPESNPLYAHTVTLTNLIDNASYHFRVRSTDSAGNIATSADTVFVTPAIQRTMATLNYQAQHCGCRGQRYAR